MFSYLKSCIFGGYLIEDYNKYWQEKDAQQKEGDKEKVSKKKETGKREL